MIIHKNMKHLIITLLLMVAFSAMAHAQECKVPISVPGLSHYSPGYSDYSLTPKFKAYINNIGYSTDIKNTRLTISLDDIRHANTLEFRVTLYDTETKTVLYTEKLDTLYEGDEPEYLMRNVGRNFPEAIPQLSPALERIRKIIITLFEKTTPAWVDVAKRYMAGDSLEMAMFHLAQYSSCCNNYPQVQSFMATTFREYVRNDHKELIRQAQIAWDYRENETDVRFVVSLLNREKLNKWNRNKADKILKKVAEEYPNIDIHAEEDYTVVPELAAVAAEMAREIGVRYGEQNVPDTKTNIPISLILSDYGQ